MCQLCARFTNKELQEAKKLGISHHPYDQPIVKKGKRNKDQKSLSLISTGVNSASDRRK